MMSTGQKKNGIRWKLHVPPVKALLFSAVMKSTGKPDGRTVWMEQILLFAQWFVIKKAHCLHPGKMPAAENAIPGMSGPVEGATEAPFPMVMHVNLKTPCPEKSAGTEPQAPSWFPPLTKV